MIGGQDCSLRCPHTFTVLPMEPGSSSPSLAGRVCALATAGPLSCPTTIETSPWHPEYTEPCVFTGTDTLDF